MCILQSPDKSRVMNNGPDKFVQIKRYTPENWKLKQLGSVVKIISGVSPSLFKLNVEGNYPYLKVEDLNNCEKYQTKSRWYSNDEKYLIPENSVIFPKRGAAILNNKVRINLTAMQIDSNLMALNPNPLIINHEFLYYQLTFEQLYKIADTSSIPQINNKHIIPYLISLPPLPEQKAIASVLSTWDEAIRLTQDLIAQKELQKKSIMQELLMGRRRLNGFEKSTGYHKTDLGLVIPSDWAIAKVKDIFNERKESSKDQWAYPLFSLTIENGLTEKTDRYERSFLLKNKDENLYKLIYPNDILFNPMNLRFGAITKSKTDKVVSVSAYYNSIYLKVDNADVDYYEALFKTSIFINLYDRIAIGSLIEKKRVHLSNFIELEIPIPCKEEQTAIARVLQLATKEINLLNAKAEKLRDQKKGLMQKLLTGKIRIKL